MFMARSRDKAQWLHTAHILVDLRSMLSKGGNHSVTKFMESLFPEERIKRMNSGAGVAGISAMAAGMKARGRHRVISRDKLKRSRPSSSPPAS